ncbi:MAG TPA: glycosyltransferase family 39 protein [Patescibacteria group bacterium]|nr:glycosyltransferase family 39 protein [Patescibacteria group bacterium]
MFKKYFTQSNLFLALILATGVFLRAYNIGTNYYFTGELGKELLYIRQFAITNTLPLIGMATSHAWLSYGPVYYWIMIPIFNLWNGSPFILFWAALVAAVIGMILNYIFVKKMISQKVAIYSTLIQSISPLLIWQTQLSKLHVFFFILSPVLMYLCYLLWNGNKKYIFWAGFIYGLMFSFHFSQIPLLVVVVFLFWIKRYVLKDYLNLVIGVLVPNITYIWNDYKIFAWLPYRTLNVADKNPGGTWQGLVEYAGRNFFWSQHFWLVGLIIFVCVFVNYIIQNKSKFKKDFLVFYLTSSISLILIANFLHGAPPIHYFLPIFTTLPILFGVYLEKYKYSYVFIVVIFLLNLYGYFNPQFGDDYIPFKKQVKTARSMVDDAKGSSFAIKRIGPYDYFPENYSQNYKYLVLLMGGKLTDNATVTYTINDFTNSYSKN